MSIATVRPKAVIRLCIEDDVAESWTKCCHDERARHLGTAYPMEVTLHLEGFSPQHSDPKQARLTLERVLKGFAPTDSRLVVDKREDASKSVSSVVVFGSPPAAATINGFRVALINSGYEVEHHAMSFCDGCARVGSGRIAGIEFHYGIEHGPERRYVDLEYEDDEDGDGGARRQVVRVEVPSFWNRANLCWNHPNLRCSECQALHKMEFTEDDTAETAGKLRCWNCHAAIWQWDKGDPIPLVWSVKDKYKRSWPPLDDKDVEIETF